MMAINNLKQMNKIEVITTEGCHSCEIIKKLIDEAIKLSKVNIDEIIYKDYKEYNKNWLKQNKITDFPTILLIKDNSIKFKFSGTRPVIVIARWLDINIK